MQRPLTGNRKYSLLLVYNNPTCTKDLYIFTCKITSRVPARPTNTNTAIFSETKLRGIFANTHEPEGNNCISLIITHSVIIEIPKQRNYGRSYLPMSCISKQLHALTTWSKTTSVFRAFQKVLTLRKRQNCGYTLQTLDGVNLR